MSLVDTAYIRQLRRTSNGKPISKSEKLVLFVLACYHKDASGESWVSLEDLAADSLLTQDEVIGILQGLERKSVLQMILDDACPTHEVCPCATIARGRGGVLEDRRAIVDPGAIVERPKLWRVLSFNVGGEGYVMRHKPSILSVKRLT